jgi:hypothetical protein
MTRLLPGVGDGKASPTAAVGKRPAPFLTSSTGGRAISFGGRSRLSGSPLWPWVLGCLALAALSLLLPSTPTYDPWAWINWGREIVGLELNTRDGPSWKPLPVLFTTAFAPFGEVAPDLWLMVARAGGLLALVLTYRLASRLARTVAPGAGHGGAAVGVASGVVGALALLVASGSFRGAALGSSEALLIALVLLAVERHLDGRHRQALMSAFAAALLRPETWPFLGLYALYLLASRSVSRRPVLGLFVLIPVLWFLPELWGSGNALRASTRANDPAPTALAFADSPGLAVIGAFFAMVVLPAGVLAGVAVIHAALAFVRRRERGTTLALALGGLAWLVLIAVMTEVGYSGNPRYLAVALGVACVLAGVGLACVAQALAVTTVGLRASLGRTGGRRRGAPAVGAFAVALAVVAVGAGAPRTAEAVAPLVDSLEYEAELRDTLDGAVARAGGRDRVLACGTPYTGPYQVQMLAYELGVHGTDVGYQPAAPGFAFRAGTTPDAEPSLTVSSRFTAVADAGPWQILSSCAAAESGS